jgi:Na+-translocating ferredoxin:NAD+ oxidoreductase RnfG subunit
MTTARAHGAALLALAGVFATLACVFAALALPLVLLEARLAQPREVARAQAIDWTYTRAVFGPAVAVRGVQAPAVPQSKAPRYRYVRVRADGYGGRIDAVLAIDADGCLRGVGVLAHRESPGYGAPMLTREALADRKGWLAGLLDRCAGTPATLATDGVTGATITANALARAVRSGLPATAPTSP